MSENVLEELEKEIYGLLILYQNVSEKRQKILISFKGLPEGTFYLSPDFSKELQSFSEKTAEKLSLDLSQGVIDDEGKRKAAEEQSLWRGNLSSYQRELASLKSASSFSQFLHKTRILFLEEKINEKEPDFLARYSKPISDPDFQKKKQIYDQQVQEEIQRLLSPVNDRNWSIITSSGKLAIARQKYLALLKDLDDQVPSAIEKLKIVPRFYAMNPDAIKKMAFLLENKRANNITDLINVYEQTIWQQQMLDAINGVVAEIQDVKLNQRYLAIIQSSIYLQLIEQTNLIGAEADKISSSIPTGFISYSFPV